MLKKINLYLNLKQKFLAIFILLSYFLIGFFEAISIGSIPLFIAYILNPEFFLEKIYNLQIKSLLTLYFSNKTEQELLYKGCILIFCIFLFKNLFSFLITLIEGKTNRSIKSSINIKLFQFYLFSNYNYHLNTNPSLILRNIMASSTAANSISLLLLVIKEVLIITGLLILIIYSGANSTFYIVFAIFSFLLLSFAVIKKILTKKSNEAAIYQSSQIKSINQFAGSIIDIKIKGKEKYFLKKYSINIYRYETINLLFKIIKSLPKLLTEMIAIIGILLIVYFYSKNNNDLSAVIPILALISLALIRTLPSLQSLMGAFTDLKFQKIYFDLIYKELKELKNINISLLDARKFDLCKFTSNITLKNINFSYQGSKKHFLENINLTINKGEKVAIIGKSGAGKSTLINIILGLLKPQSGSIEVDNKKIQLEKNSRLVWENLSYIPQDVYLLDDTVAKNIAFGVDQQKINFSKINKIIKICDLEQFAEDQSNGINTIIGNRGIRISGGQKQRLGFARALYSEPKILFIDEATSNLDSITEKKIINNIFNNYNNITIVVITHKIKNLRNFKKIFLLSDGKIVKKGNYNVINKFYKKINKK